MSFALALIINDSAPMWAYFGPHTRLWSFCAGALMAFLTGGGQSAVGGTSLRLTVVQLGGLGLLLIPSLLYDSTLAYPGVVALAPVGGTLLLLAAGGAATTAMPGRLLASAPLAGLGRLSYSWYLWHWPLIVLGGVLVPDLSTGGRLAWGFAGLAAAMLTHRLLERPASTAVLNRAATERPLIAAAGVSLGLALLGAGAAWSSAHHVEQSAHSRYLAARNDHMPHECWGRSALDDESASCVFGDTGSTTTIALLGDSHASHWLAGLEKAGEAHGWKFDIHVMGACPVADLRGLIQGVAERLYGDCATFKEGVLRRLAAARPRAVILSNADYYVEPPAATGRQTGIPVSAWTEGLRRTYERFNRMGTEVIVMRGLPWVPFDVPSCLSRRAAKLPFAGDCLFVPDRAFITIARQAQDEAARGLAVRFIDMNDQVCGPGPGSCASERAGMILFADDNHITRTFSRSLSDELGTRLAAALAGRAPSSLSAAGIRAIPD
ncbi:MAG: acyltransferase family protein [Gemmatimonadota bacterium]